VMWVLWRSYPPFFHDNTFIVYEKILSGRVTFPPFFTDAAKDLISRLLQADLSKRYGCMKNGEEDIMNHAFFTEIDFGTRSPLPSSFPVPVPPRPPAQSPSRGSQAYFGDATIDTNAMVGATQPLWRMAARQHPCSPR
jgi:serine/threonine protein kinase